MPKKKPQWLNVNHWGWNKSLAVTYSRMEKLHTTIGAKQFHFRVRDGIGWFPLAMAARQIFSACGAVASCKSQVARGFSLVTCYLLLVTAVVRPQFGKLLKTLSMLLTNPPLQTAWVLYGQASRSISTG